MNKSQLIEALANGSCISQKASKQVVNTVFMEMEKALIRGDRIEIRGVGSFTIKEYEQHQVQTPNAGENAYPAMKRLPCFKVGKELKERVDMHEG